MARYLYLALYFHNNNNPVGTIPPQRIVVWEFVAPMYGYREIGMKCAMNNLI